MRSLMRKELREVFGLTAAALGCYLALLVSLMRESGFVWVPGLPHGPEDVPFVSGSFMEPFTLISILFAVALGLRQSAWESSRGTYLFLLHRPVHRETIFLTKLATGAGVLLLGSGLPVALYMAWSAMLGHHAGPFEWSMSGPAWRLVILMPLVYLGAFLSGLRPARWFGTRLLPLAAAVGLLVLVNVLPWWWYLSVPLAVVLYAALTANVLFVARVRDYA
jgi:ABC-type transport system involved in multi-copper enzyme maturation permease subunit